VFHVKHRIRRLVEGEEAALDPFLATHTVSSMFMRSNLRRVGLVDRGEPYQATYVAAFDRGEVVGVVGHCWNGMLLVQAPAAVELLAPEAVAASGREVLGVSGPGEQVTRARRALGLESAETTEDSIDDLFSLELGAMKVPAALTEGRVTVRHPDAGELGLMADWSASFHREALGFADGPELRRNCSDQVRRLQEEGAQFVLDLAGAPVAYAAFNATLPDTVQLGGVWTPAAFRGRGYGRSVVAGALLAARAAGVTRAVLFTGPNNRAAQAAYHSLGFERVGDYGLVIFAGSGRL
jgi:ribosomal protein S18 acetylase RimI-like enzyme